MDHEEKAQLICPKCNIRLVNGVCPTCQMTAEDIEDEEEYTDWRDRR